jgi:adenylyl-sulfate kinase
VRPPAPASRPAPAAANLTWHAGSLTRDQRRRALGQTGATVWLTGLPASGKSTLACALEDALVRAGRGALRLDGDNVRHGLCADLGFSAADRAENIRRVGEAALLLAEAGTVAVVCLVSPYAADRARVRARHAAAGLGFLEVWVSTPLAECERRDPKGLYARARRGEITGMTGWTIPTRRPTRRSWRWGRRSRSVTRCSGSARRLTARRPGGAEAAPRGR